jgi:hypothetical protein
MAVSQFRPCPCVDILRYSILGYSVLTYEAIIDAEWGDQIRPLLREFAMRLGFALPNIGPIATAEAVSKVAQRRSPGLR